ncbi:prorelaxin H1 [Sphaeramia orbicularis]|uniref:Relaxin-3-like n=1 Tax=Sphaeramia orbicularis TaxID=375764 RepID=A0A672YE43_9TELE|nr:relaxin-3-like [Sphaeramia orbicularis]
MLWKLTLAVVVVCVGGICSSVRADIMSKLIMPRDYGVKLCGREFIRAVIFTCGGSRWRRSTDADLDLFQSSSFSDVPAEDTQQTFQHSAELSDSRYPLRIPSSSSLSDLLAIYGAYGDLQQVLSEPVSLDNTQQSPAQDNRPVPSKKKRNFSLGVAGMCCSQGCTKHDIGRLC